MPQQQELVTPQQEFDAKYMDIREIQSIMGLNVTTFTIGIRSGALGDPDVLCMGGRAKLWLRERVMPLIADWKRRMGVEE